MALLWLVVAVWLASPGLATQQRSLSQLEYVVRALEQQGRLHEVDRWDSSVPSSSDLYSPLLTSGAILQ